MTLDGVLLPGSADLSTMEWAIYSNTGFTWHPGTPEATCTWWPTGTATTAGTGGDGHLRAAASEASFSMRAQSPAARASAGVSQVPPTQPTFGSAR